SVAARSIPDRTALAQGFILRRALKRGAAAAHAAEDGERVRRGDLPDELAAGLGLAVEALGQRPRFVLRSGAHEQVGGALDDVVAFAFELLRELAGALAGLELDTHLPWGVTALELLFLPCFLRRLTGPAFLVGKPALDLGHLRLDPFLGQLG